MAIATAVEEQLESILSAVSELSNSDRAVLWDTFFVLNALALAKYLYGLAGVPDSVGESES